MSEEIQAILRRSEKLHTNLSGINHSESEVEMKRSDWSMYIRSLNGVIKKAKKFLFLNKFGGIQNVS